MIGFQIISLSRAGKRSRFFFILAGTTVVALGREKLVYGEAHLFKDIAGVLGVGTAFFRWHTEIVDGHQHLYVANELYDGEDP